MRGEIAVGFCVGNLVDDLGFSTCRCLILPSCFLSIRCYSLRGHRGWGSLDVRFCF